jgi:signal peptidase II
VSSTPRRRLAVVAAAGTLLGVDLAAKAAVERSLADGQTIDLGPVDLRLGYNTGAAFSMGNGLPTWVLVTVTAAITLAVAGYAWRIAGRPGSPAALLVGLTAVLAGALGNLIDRAGDGRVTDYLYTGWFATFNLADAFITLGAINVAGVSLLVADPGPQSHSTDSRPTRAPEGPPPPSGEKSSPLEIAVVERGGRPDRRRLRGPGTRTPRYNRGSHPL